MSAPYAARFSSACLAGLDHADGQAEEAEDRAHPVRVALREVFVDRDDVRALAGQRVQVGGQRRDERLAFAGAHLRDLAVVQDHAADQLHVEVAQPERAARGLADHGERLGQDVVERSARGQFARGTSAGCAARSASLSACSSGSRALMRRTEAAYWPTSRWLRLPNMRVSQFVATGAPGGRKKRAILQEFRRRIYRPHARTEPAHPVGAE